MKQRMIKVAICEDSDLDRDILKEIISFLLADRGLGYDINPYSSGRELVSGYKNHPFDIIFLDILMDDIDGIETGRLIREMDDKVEIVYCTSSKDFAIAAYDVHAMGYLLKPYETLRIGAVIDYYVQKHPQKNHNFIEVKSNRKSLIIPYKDIIHMESDNKVVYIYTTTQGAVKVYNKLDAFESELSDARFLRCHQSYLVNMQYVAGIVDSDFIMIDDQMIPIRKSGRKLIVKKYEDYLKESFTSH
ncbi:MAG: LytTR family DNA-binding domain-containing protein [Lachnospiraceae bacterium]